jgi:hypothetical protein
VIFSTVPCAGASLFVVAMADPPVSIPRLSREFILIKSRLESFVFELFIL